MSDHYFSSPALQGAGGLGVVGALEIFIFDAALNLIMGRFYVAACRRSITVVLDVHIVPALGWAKRDH